jgi:hypothetical protein
MQQEFSGGKVGRMQNAPAGNQGLWNAKYKKPNILKFNGFYIWDMW